MLLAAVVEEHRCLPLRGLSVIRKAVRYEAVVIIFVEVSNCRNDVTGNVKRRWACADMTSTRFIDITSSIVRVHVIPNRLVENCEI